MLLLSEAETASLVTRELAFDAARAALVAACHAGTTTFPVVEAHGSATVDRFTVKAAATTDLAGLKIGSYWPGNEAHGRARHHSLILLFDQRVGRIRVAVEAGIVNAFRTAAADAVAVDLLARPEASVLAVFGAGHQARHELAAIACVRPPSTCLVVARDRRKCAAAVAEFRRQGLPAEEASPQAACEAADVIVTATSARSPLFDARWIRPGTHIASMGSDAMGKQELPPELFDGARLFCDLDTQSRRIGEFQHAGSAVALTNIGEVIVGRAPGRLSPDDVTIFDSSGLSVQDLHIARELVRLVAPDLL